MTQPHASRAQGLLLFGRNFLKHPRMLGSLIPSSPFLVKRLLRKVDWARATVLMEYGPGVGTFTAEILRRMRPDANLVALETNADFVRFLRSRLKDPRLRVVHGSAADAESALRQFGFTHADYVISGIPYTTMPPELREQIVRNTQMLLSPSGAFLVYQFTRAVRPSLEEVFGVVREDFEPLNVMPARLFYCRAHPDHLNGSQRGTRANGNGAGTRS